MNTTLHISFRATTRSDAGFAYDVLEATMRPYAMSTWGVWLEEQARHALAREVEDGNTRLIEVRNTPAGIVRVERLLMHVQLEQLYILPRFQGAGVGSVAIRLVLAEAAENGLPVELSVLRVNPARGFYERHGFVVCSETNERWHMRHAA